MYILDFKGSIIKLKLTHLIHKTISENDIIRLAIEYEGVEKEYSSIVIEKMQKYIYVELIDEIIKIDNVRYIQKL